ncbi:MAG: signal peptidase II [Bauldia sp.]|nr:signal peptidase II [Bauldia sp.]MCW5717034.1 signal peptidase II [Bauldia sp.]
MTDAPAPARSIVPPGPASRFGITVMAGTLIVDQVSKSIAVATIKESVPRAILPILDLYYTENPGIAFSFLRGSNPTLLLIAVIAVAIAILVFWARSKEGGKLAALGFGFIVGGAIGNIVDRLVYGHVIDFLHLHIGARTLFVFNLADVALTLGPILLVAAFLLPQRRGT